MSMLILWLLSVVLIWVFVRGADERKEGGEVRIALRWVWDKAIGNLAWALVKMLERYPWFSDAPVSSRRWKLAWHLTMLAYRADAIGSLRDMFDRMRDA